MSDERLEPFSNELEAEAYADGQHLAEEAVTAFRGTGIFENKVIQGFCKNMVQQHRTHQQGVGRIVVGWLKFVADSECDGRNAGLVDFARSIKKQLDEAHLPFV